VNVQRIDKTLTRGGKVARLIRELRAQPMTWPDAIALVGCTSRRTWQGLRADIEAGGFVVESAGDVDAAGQMHRLYWINK